LAIIDGEVVLPEAGGTTDFFGSAKGAEGQFDQIAGRSRSAPPQRPRFKEAAVDPVSIEWR
jgi:hypothetical protein